MSDFGKLTPQPVEPPDPFGKFINDLDVDDFNPVDTGDSVSPQVKDSIDQAIETYRVMNTDSPYPGQFIPVDPLQADIMKATLAHVRNVLIELDGQTVNGMQIMVYAIGIFAIAFNNYVDQYLDDDEEDINGRF